MIIKKPVRIAPRPVNLIVNPKPRGREVLLIKQTILKM